MAVTFKASCKPSAPFTAAATAVLSLTGAAFGVINETTTLEGPDAVAGENFGSAVAVSGTNAVIGAPSNDEIATNAGAAYLFELQGGVWLPSQPLEAAGLSENRQYGASVAVDGMFAAVGAPTNQFALEEPGAVFVFRDKLGMGWIENQELSASDGTADDRFGAAVSIDGEVVLVGAPGSNQAYVFRFDGASWVEEAVLIGSDAAADDEFGFSVALSGDVAVVGAPFNNAGGNDAGRIYIFEFDGLDWIEVLADTPAGMDALDRFGWSVSVDGDFIVVGAPSADLAGVVTGTATFYEFDGLVWDDVAELDPAGGGNADSFGSSVSVSNTLAVIGSSGDNGGASFSGSAYLFSRNGVWAEEDQLLAAVPGMFDELGRSVSISGDTAMTGAPFNDAAANNAGRVYVFSGFFDGPTCPGDINTDGEVNSVDLNLVLAAFGDGDGGDADGDGDTDSADLNIVLGNFAATCPGKP